MDLSAAYYTVVKGQKSQSEENTVSGTFGILAFFLIQISWRRDLGESEVVLFRHCERSEAISFHLLFSNLVNRAR